VDRVCVSFPGSAQLFPAGKKAVYTGNPLRGQLRKIPAHEAREALGLSPSLFTVLIAGGSQGSATINRRWIEALAGLPSNRLQAVHITGSAQHAEVKAAYEASGIRCAVFPFLREMELAYSAADAALTRAGAMTCAELGYYSLPAFIVPYPFAQGHQSRNAAALQGQGCCLVVEDARVDAAAITRFLKRCMDEPGYLPGMKGRYPPVGRDDSSSALVRACMEIL
jgi:UDP-N-acetylglucosamine--N-acetylmuramyl-(pentapeptide) pyrophosphoryl-undecaprenol N-acetylglucosamine transferase